MVTSSTPAAQVSENDKRRKQAMEKIKANHLSRQLQMRLQSRLKVEHGWQNQNLNEVENLYFHNSHHLRGSKPYPTPTIVTTQQQQQPSFSGPQAGPSQSSLSFKVGSSSLVRTPVNPNPVMEKDQSQSPLAQNDANPSSDVQLVPNAEHTIATPTTDPSVGTNILRGSSAMEVDSHDGAPSLVINTYPPAANEVIENVDLPPEDPSSVANSSSSPRDGQSPVDPSSSNNHYPFSKPQRPRINKGPAGARALQSLTAKDMHNFGTGSTLTYDSFWNSHSGSNAPRPPRQSGPMSNGPTFQIPGDFTSGFPDVGRGNSPFVSSSINVAAPTINLESKRGPGGLT
ncbi:hypothetical protein M413DRAFT_383497 [Hebeloma cylindrosporum]|uniref:Uncharacterized protein n=1 Tax=Hebeloma cylindrosporum TaxID=76867 RepID=A0A0C2Y125_HEBCY|nr:hypothetical protein M413DRAFT_383497 [Hebeloma cylindrosporum h7]